MSAASSPRSRRTIPSSASPALGVHVIKAEARFKDQRTVIAGESRSSAPPLRDRDRLIAGGAADPRPRRRCDFLTNETIFELTRRPGHLIVIGGGPIGIELAQALSPAGLAR